MGRNGFKQQGLFNWCWWQWQLEVKLSIMKMTLNATANFFLSHFNHHSWDSAYRGENMEIRDYFSLLLNHSFQHNIQWTVNINFCFLDEFILKCFGVQSVYISGDCSHGALQYSTLSFSIHVNIWWSVPTTSAFKIVSRI